MKNILPFLSASALVCSVLSPSALAQSNERDTDPGGVVNKKRMLEEIIVTAQRREQNLMSTPLSIQAMSGEELIDTGIEDLTSLQFVSPGYLPDTNNGFVQIYMRGIGNAIFIGADPSVATFVDDVPQIYGISVDTLVDLERIEILKGAQGGLYGRNATGGVVNIITRQPSTDEIKGDLRLSYGEENTFRGAGYINLPLGEMAAWSLSLERASHDEYVDNLAARVPYTAANFPNGSFLGTPQQTADFFNSPQNPSDIYDQDFKSARSKLLLTPTDDFSFTLAGSYAKKDDTNSSQFVSTTPEYNQAALEGLFTSFGIDVDLPPGFIIGDSRGKWKTAIGPKVYSGIRDYSIYGTAVWNGPGFDITSITAYRNLKTSTRGDSATSAVAFVPFDIKFNRDYFYQELRAISTFDGPWSFLGGATYLNNHLNGRNDVYFLSYDILYGTTKVDQKVHNWSVYGEAGYEFTDRIKLTGSARYMHEKNEADFTLPVTSSTDSDNDKIIPSATLSYELDDGNLYLRWARGFKTGGVNIVTAPFFYPQPTDGSVFDPEDVDTYEAGFKTTLLDRSLQVTGAIFYNDYGNLQVDVRARPEYPAITTAIINADSATTYGAEGSVTWKVADPVTIGINAGYLHAEYDNFSLSGSQVLSDFDLSGKKMPKSPKWQYSLNASLDQPISEDFRLVSDLLVSHTSSVTFKYSAFPGVLPDAKGPSYWLVNARVGIKTSDDRVGLFVVADNLFDEKYYIGADSGAFGNLQNYGQPRIIRGEITYQF